MSYQVGTDKEGQFDKLPWLVVVATRALLRRDIGEKRCGNINILNLIILILRYILSSYMSSTILIQILYSTSRITTCIIGA